MPLKYVIWLLVALGIGLIVASCGGSSTPTSEATPTIATATATTTSAPTTSPGVTPTVVGATPTPTSMQPATPSPSPIASPARGIRVEVVAQDLDTPWALAFAPDGRLFVTERGGAIRVLQNGQVRPYLKIDEVAEEGESGLLGLALDPDFQTTRHLFIYHTYRTNKDVLQNRVVRWRDTGETAVEPTIVLDGIPGARIHDGGRIKFGPDGLLYIAAGDAAFAEQAQDIDSFGGKILGINKDGSIPKDNPFSGSPVYSYGHRNPQGLAFHPVTGQLFDTEHGSSATDEVNLVLSARNYGWPTVRGDQHREPYQKPVLHSGSVTWAPSGAAFYPIEGGVLPPEWAGRLVYATLVGQRLRWITLNPPDYTSLKDQGELFQGQYGRLRDVIVGPDGYIYFCTSNRDGRGSPQPGDDKILRIVPVP